MKENYIELKESRDFGDIINTYFEFFKLNLKSFTNVFISYNGIFIFLLLGISYLMVTGFIGMYNVETGFGNGTQDESAMLVGFGVLLFFVVFIIIAALNYSLASSYMINYDEQKQVVTDKKLVWNIVRDNIGRILIFILLLAVIYVIYMIISLVLSFIPLIGFLAQNVIGFALTAWFGISFMVMLNENKSPIDAFGEGWDLVKSNFWKTVGANFILGILVGLILLLILMIPGIIVGVYTYHAVSIDTAIGESVLAKVIYTFGLCIFFVVIAYSQSLSQFINGILYYALHEEKYNVNTRQKIDQIGASE
ncbi:hypothetical protein [uncultured Aquimarina sp.]|uniref:hypothetical protein n=1 Tax=uncultured Aquimarina sp. TaxID=575652 RepID=UPI0026274A59|nr:hypothetical protein [uncultured Aquimarina sp.]